jgi:hypothetical protein
MPTAAGLLRRAEIPKFIERELGLKISFTTLNNLSRPDCGGGPPPEGRWCNAFLYEPRKVIAWAENLFKNGLPRDIRARAYSYRLRQDRRAGKRLAGRQAA